MEATCAKSAVHNGQSRSLPYGVVIVAYQRSGIDSFWLASSNAAFQWLLFRLKYPDTNGVTIWMFRAVCWQVASRYLYTETELLLSNAESKETLCPAMRS